MSLLLVPQMLKEHLRGTQRYLSVNYAIIVLHTSGAYSASSPEYVRLFLKCVRVSGAGKLQNREPVEVNCGCGRALTTAITGISGFETQLCVSFPSLHLLTEESL